MSLTNNLISSHIDREIRRNKKRQNVLRFLRQHLWSSQDILQEIMDLSSRQSAHKTLMQLESESLIKRYSFQALGGPITLWGITAHGQALAFYVGQEEMVKAIFEQSKVSEQNIRHQLDLQKLRVIAERCGWSNWTDGDRLGSLDKNTKRPDAIVNNNLGLIIAIECERSFKSLKRYEKLLLNYLKQIKNGEVSKVVWVSPTEDFKKRLEVLIKSIKSLNVSGQVVQIDPKKHHINLNFCSYQEWPQYCKNVA